MTNREKYPEEPTPAARVAQYSDQVPQVDVNASSPVMWQASRVQVPPVLGSPAGILMIQQLKGNRAVSQMLAVQQSAHARGSREPSDEAVRSAAAEGVRTPAVSLPFLDCIQASFGCHSIGHIKVHVGPEAAKASRAMNALAFTSGDHVVFGDTPDLHTAAHEAAHVVQQQAGVQLAGGIGREGDAYERNADAVADAVVAGRSAEGLLEPFSPSTTIGEEESPQDKLEAQRMAASRNLTENSFQVRVKQLHTTQEMSRFISSNICQMKGNLENDAFIGDTELIWFFDELEAEGWLIDDMYYLRTGDSPVMWFRVFDSKEQQDIGEWVVKRVTKSDEDNYNKNILAENKARFTTMTDTRVIGGAISNFYYSRYIQPMGFANPQTTRDMDLDDAMYEDDGKVLKFKHNVDYIEKYVTALRTDFGMNDEDLSRMAIFLGDLISSELNLDLDYMNYDPQFIITRKEIRPGEFRPTLVSFDARFKEFSWSKFEELANKPPGLLTNEQRIELSDYKAMIDNHEFFKELKEWIQL